MQGTIVNQLREIYSVFTRLGAFKEIVVKSMWRPGRECVSLGGRRAAVRRQITSWNELRLCMQAIFQSESLRNDKYLAAVGAVAAEL